MTRLLWFLLFSLPLMAQTELQKGQELFIDGNFPQAKIIIAGFVKKNPNHLVAIELLGDIFASTNEWDHAFTCYEKLKTLKPGVANYEYKYGGALGMVAKNSNKFKALGMIADIRKSFENAIRIDPKHIDARWALIELNLQLPAIVGGSESAARQYAAELLKISPIDGYLANGHIAEYYQRYKSAELSYKSAIAVGQSKTAYQKLANLYKNKMQQPQKATILMAEYQRTL